MWDTRSLPVPHTIRSHTTALVVIGLVVIYVLAVLVFLTCVTLYAAGRLFRGETYPPARALWFAVQAYCGLTLAMAALYAGVEHRSKGEPFSGMFPAHADGRRLQPSSVDYQMAQEEHAEYRNDFLRLQVDAFNFSVMTAAAVGYGDIAPVWPTMRLAVTAQVLVSQMILVIVIGTVFSRFSSGKGAG